MIAHLFARIRITLELHEDRCRRRRESGGPRCMRVCWGGAA